MHQGHRHALQHPAFMRVLLVLTWGLMLVCLTLHPLSHLTAPLDISCSQESLEGFRQMAVYMLTQASVSLRFVASVCLKDSGPLLTVDSEEGIN